MPEDVRGSGLIGPNAILQLVPVLDRAGLTDRVLARAGVFELPSDAGLMPEAPAARVHQALRAEDPELAPVLAWEAGVRTARYIMAHRIPPAAQALLRWLPGWLAQPILEKAIARHAWTFAGSGRFAVLGRGVFEIADNPIVAREQSPVPLCHWHAAVFETLFSSLVDPRITARETECCATGARACRFELSRGQTAAVR